LDFTVPAIYLRNLSTGLSIVAKSRDLGGKKFHGEVVSIDNQIDQVTRSIRVRALLDNADHELKQGMLMLVDLKAAARDAVVISEAALVPLGSNNFVFVVNKNGDDSVVERRQITIGERLEGAVEVLKGLSVDEQLVTHGLQKIRPGQKVRVLVIEAPVGAQGESTHLSDLIQQKNN
jgi:membrane fusion protein, multidrug efflux system